MPVSTKITYYENKSTSKEISKLELQLMKQLSEVKYLTIKYEILDMKAKAFM